MNPPDPASVKALLEQLRVSQAWQEIQASSNNNNNNNDVYSVTPQDPTSSSTVAELLAQLKKPTNSAASLPPVTRYDPPPPPPQLPPHQAPPAPHAPAHAVKHCTFQNALPVIAKLGEDPAFLAALKEIRNDQNRLEELLWSERDAIHRKYTEKVNAAKIKATMIGAGITAHEAAMLQDAYQRELRKFDEGRVLKAWDSLISKQQTRLESLGVPNMFAGSHPQARDKQAQIMQVLVGLLD